jgi:hypothetical protein
VGGRTAKAFFVGETSYLPPDKKRPPSSSASTFLKKFKMLPFGFPGVFALNAFFALWELTLRTLAFVFVRGVKGLADDEGPAMAIVEPVRLLLRPSGGVGARPVEGFKVLSLVASSRGLRNMALRSGSRHGLVLTGLYGGCHLRGKRGFRDIVFTRDPVTTLVRTKILIFITGELAIGSKAFL